MPAKKTRAPARKPAASKALKPKKVTSKKLAAPIRHQVELDEPSRFVASPDLAFDLQTSDGVDSLAEELGEEFVQNVTGADDAAVENRDNDPEGSFVFTTAATEFADGTDASNPPDAEREALPTT